MNSEAGECMGRNSMVMSDQKELMNASKERKLQDDGRWETLNLNEAVTSFERMTQVPCVDTYICVLQKCRKDTNLPYAKRLHAYMCRSGLEAHRFLGNYLVPLLVECGSMCDALQVFNRLVDPNEYSGTSLIMGYIDCGEPQHALNLYKKMQAGCVHLSTYTFVAALKACARLKDAEGSPEIHAEIARKGLDANPFVGNTLVDMYAKCGWLAKAREVFDKLPVRDVVSWNALISGYVEHGVGEEALGCFEQMQVEGVPPDAVTFVCSLKACVCTGVIDKGEEIHGQITGKGLERDLFVGSTLVDMYAKFGLLVNAQLVLGKLPVRDVVLWNALITGYAESGLGQEALNCFEQMQVEGVSPDAVTVVCILKACSSTGAMGKGCEIQAYIARKGLERDLFVGSTLVDMYAKCGLLGKAREVFDKLRVRDVVLWTAIIAGYADHGLCEEALNCFEQMQQEGISPDVVSWSALITGYAQLGESEMVFHMLERMRREGIDPNGVTFLSVLNVCSHAGLVDMGQEYFEAMSKVYGITPTIEHHICMVDLHCRAGQLHKGVSLVEKMPFKPVLALWHTVLGACRKWGNVELGRHAFEHAVRLDEKDAAAYALMSNIYALAHMYEDEKKVEAMRVEKQAWKKPGQSWTEVDGIMHTFVVGDTRHSQSKHIYAKLEDLSQKIQEKGCAPDMHCVSLDICKDAEEHVFYAHSEMLAIACAILNTPDGAPIRVVKNLRVCDNCHEASKLVSKIERRTIFVRDANHVHVFKEGRCTCGDYW